MPEFTGPDSFSDGVDRLLSDVRPHGRPSTAFPVGLDGAQTRREAGETLHTWFRRLVDAFCHNDPANVAIEENIAVFASLAWRDGRLEYASLPTLVVVGASLEEYYLDGNGQPIYLRLDLNYATLGEPFSHPLAHVHVVDDDHPRFALDGGSSGNVVVDFLEFLYRNYAPQKWLAWARREWRKGQYAPDDAEADPFDTVVKAFRDNQFQVLKQHAQVVAQVKRTLRASKDSLFGNHMNGLDRGVLEYPTDV